MMNVLFIYHMLRAHDVSNILLEYKPSPKSTAGLTENNIYPEESITNYNVEDSHLRSSVKLAVSIILRQCLEMKIS